MTRRLDQGGFMSDAGKFAGIFDGLRQAYGTYNVNRKNANGKNLGKANLVREPRTTALWEKHLSGEGVSVGIIPINETNECRWGCIDVDEYPLLMNIRSTTQRLLIKSANPNYRLLFVGANPAVHIAFCSARIGLPPKICKRFCRI